MIGDLSRRSALRVLGVATGSGLLAAEAALADSDGDASGDGDEDAGATLTYTTDSESGTGPTIDGYAVTEVRSPGPHAEITADWAAADAEGDLDQVRVRVYGSNGSLVDSARTKVGGASATGTNTWTLRHGTGETFEVQVTVTDAAGSSTLQTWSVSA